MKLVMFDIDGTLTESNSLDDESYLQALHEVFGFSEILSDWTSYINTVQLSISFLSLRPLRLGGSLKN
ncbi:HAD family hydrolase [Nostoc sp.]|uniref:HAD family hydrolase n=1 Tax=Nostoc sp. TaxID=1180 RepID=UPI002FFA8BB2